MACVDTQASPLWSSQLHSDGSLPELTSLTLDRVTGSSEMTDEFGQRAPGTKAGKWKQKKWDFALWHLCPLLNVKNFEALFHHCATEPLSQPNFLFERECRPHTDTLYTLYPVPPVVASYKTTAHITTRELSLMRPRLRTFPSAQDAHIAKPVSLPPHLLLNPCAHSSVLHLCNSVTSGRPHKQNHVVCNFLGLTFFHFA